MINHDLINARAINAQSAKTLAVAFGATATLTCVATVVFAASAAMAGAATCTPSLFDQQPLSGTGAINGYRINAPSAIDAKPQTLLSVAMAGDSACSATAQLTMAVSASLDGAGVCSPRQSLATSVAASLTGAAALSDPLPLTYAVAASLDGSGGFTATLSTPFPRGSFTANFLTEAAKANGTRPLCILYMDFASGRVFASDHAPDLTAWTGGPALQAWVVDWGGIDDVASLDLADTPVLAGDYRLRLHIPDGLAGSGTLWTHLTDPTNVPEQTVVRLYCWFRDLTLATDPPVAIWEGTFRDWHWVDEQTLEVQCADAIELYDRPVGRAATTVNFPNCDPDDVGKVEPIIYGSVEGVPCLAIDAGPNSPLSQDLTAAATALYYSNTGTGFGASGSIVIEAEQIAYSGVTTETLSGVVHGKLLGLTRGANGTTAVAHNKGTVLVQAQSAYTYLAAGQRMKSVSKVYVEDDRGNAILQSGNYAVNLNNGAFPDGQIRTTVTFSVLPKVTRQVNLAVQTTETIAVTKGGTVQDGIGVSDTIGVTAAALTLTAQDAPSGSFPRDFGVGAGGAVTMFSFPAPAGTIIRQTVTLDCALITVGISGGQQYGGQVGISGGPASGIYILGNDSWLPGTSVILGRSSVTLTMNADGNAIFLQGQITRAAAAPNQTGVLRVYSATRSYTYAQAPSVSKTGAASKTGTTTENITTTKTGTVTTALTGNSAADTVIGGRVLIDGEGYADDGQYAAAGVFTGSSGALIQNTRDALRHFLTAHMGFAPADLQLSSGLAADMGSTYQINGCIVEPAQARTIASRMAFESGCWLKFAVGKPTLIFRKRVVSASVTLGNGDVAFIQQTKQTADIQKMPVEWIINKIELRYNRDFGLSKGFSAYRALEVYPAVSSEPTASQRRYNVKTRPALFQFDFVRTQAHAAAVAALYVGIHQTRRDLIKLRTFLQRPNQAFGDRIGIDNRMVSNQVGELVSVDFTPGNAAQQKMPQFLLTFLALDAS